MGKGRTVLGSFKIEGSRRDQDQPEHDRVVHQCGKVGTT
jgi:hypothetical protein